MIKEKKKSIIYYFYKCSKEKLFFKAIYILFVVLIVAKKWSWERPEWFEGANFYFDLSINLFMGFFVSIFFYILIVYIPEEKRREKIYEKISYTAGKMYYFLILQVKNSKISDVQQQREKLSIIRRKKDIKAYKEFYEEERLKLEFNFEKTEQFILKNQLEFIKNYNNFNKDLEKIKNISFAYLDINLYEELENVVEMVCAIKEEYNFIQELQNKGSEYSYQLRVQERSVSKFLNHLKNINENYISNDWKFYMKNSVLIELYEM